MAIAILFKFIFKMFFFNIKKTKYIHFTRALITYVPSLIHALMQISLIQCSIINHQDLG